MPNTVLIVDDDATVAWSLSAAVRLGGRAALTAPGVRRARRLLERNPVDLVITDLRMPDEDGLVLARELQARDPDLPVLLCTAYADAGTWSAARAAGCWDLIPKPVDRDRLESALVAAEHRARQADVPLPE